MEVIESLDSRPTNVLCQKDHEKQIEEKNSNKINEIANKKKTVSMRLTICLSVCLSFSSFFSQITKQEQKKSVRLILSNCGRSHDHANKQMLLDTEFRWKLAKWAYTMPTVNTPNNA